MVFVSCFHNLNPFNIDFVFYWFMFSFILRKISNFLETEYAETPINKEVKFFLDLILDEFENRFTNNFWIVRNFRLKFDSVLIDTFNFFAIKFNLEVVWEELKLFTLGFWISLWLFWEQGDCCWWWFHLCKCVCFEK